MPDYEEFTVKYFPNLGCIQTILSYHYYLKPSLMNTVNKSPDRFSLILTLIWILHDEDTDSKSVPFSPFHDASLYHINEILSQ